MRPSTFVLLGLAVVVAAAGVPASSLAGADPSAEVIARYPGDDGMDETTVVAPDAVGSVGEPLERDGRWQVPVTLTEAGAESFAQALVEAGFTSDGVNACSADGERNDDGYCLLTVVDGDVVSALGLAPGLADSIESGDFEDDPRFLLVTDNESTAERAAAAFDQTADGTGTETSTDGDTGADVTTADSGVQTTADAAGGSSASVPGVGVLGSVTAVLLGVAVGRCRR